MSKVTDFYAKVMADEALKAELGEVLGGKDIAAATDDELLKIGDIAKKAGFDITVDEAKAYLNPEETALDDDDLDAVAGGKGDTTYGFTCTSGGMTESRSCAQAGGNIDTTVTVG